MIGNMIHKGLKLLVTTLRFDISLIFSPAFLAFLMNSIIPDMLLLAFATHSMSKAFKQFQTYLILQSVLVTVVFCVIWHLF